MKTARWTRALITMTGGMTLLIAAQMAQVAPPARPERARPCTALTEAAAMGTRERPVPVHHLPDPREVSSPPAEPASSPEEERPSAPPVAEADPRVNARVDEEVEDLARRAALAPAQIEKVRRLLARLHGEDARVRAQGPGRDPWRTIESFNTLVRDTDAGLRRILGSARLRAFDAWRERWMSPETPG